jgi:hypothetical protein
MLAAESIHGGDRKSKSRDVTLNLASLGISKMQSHRWQAAARVPEELFQKWFAETVESEKMPTSGTLIKLGKQSYRKRWAEAGGDRRPAPRRGPERPGDLFSHFRPGLSPPPRKISRP